jgi:hypothetical protein
MMFFSLPHLQVNAVVKYLEQDGASKAYLPPPELLALALKDIPYLQYRLQAWEFQKTFEEVLGDVHPFIQAGIFALKQLNESQKLKSLLRVCVFINILLLVGVFVCLLVICVASVVVGVVVVVVVAVVVFAFFFSLVCLVFVF